MRRIPTSIVCALAGAALLIPSSGCVAVAAGAVAGYVVTQEVLPNDVHTATVADDVDLVWASVQDTMRGMSTEPVTITEMPRVVTAVVDGADVTVEVQAYDIDRTVIEVHAERYLASRSAIAGRVLDGILARLSR